MNPVGQVVFMLLAASSLEQAPAEPRDHKKTKRELRKRSAQVRLGTGLQPRIAATITKTLWPSDPASTCENKQGSVTKAPYIRELGSDFRVQESGGFFPALRIKFHFY